MRIGITLPSYATPGRRMTGDRLKRLARRIEAAGFAGIWIPEHLTRPPGREYSWLAPLATAATVVGATGTVPVGTSIVVAALRDPVLLAQRAATIQHLSDGRFSLGLGAGYVRADFEAVGVPHAERGPRFSEGLSLVRRLLTEPTVTFDGRFYRVDGFSLEPRPDRPPRLLVGGGGVERDGDRVVPEGVADRLVADGDGWIAAPRTPELIARDWGELAGRLEAAGRDPASIDRLAMNWAYLVPDVDADLAWEKQRRVFAGKDDPDHAREHYLTGSVGDVRERLEWYRDAGFDEVILGPVTADPAAFERQLERYAELLGDFV